MIRAVQQWLTRDYTIALLGCIALAFTPLVFFALALLLYILARMLVIVRFGLIGKLAVAFFIVAAVNGCIAAVAWQLHIPLSASLVIAAQCVMLLAIASVTHASLPPLFKLKKREVWDIDDLVALGATALFAFFMISPILPKPSAAILGPLIMWGGDNSAHINMIKIDDLNKGFAIGLTNTYNAPRTLITYPQGWHFNGAFLKWTIDPLLSVAKSPARLLTFFYLVCVLWLSLLTFALIRAALHIKSTFSKETSKANIPSLLVVATVIIAFVSVLLVPPFAFGFQTQISSLAFLLVEVLLIALSYQVKTIAARFILLLLAGLMLAGGCLSWLFLFPIGGLILAGAVLHTWYQTKKLPLYFILLGAYVAAGILFQPVIQVLIPTPGFEDGILNQPGFTAQLQVHIIVALTGLCGICAFFMTKVKTARVFFVALCLSLAFSLGVMAYQLSTVEELRYYYYKSLYTAFIFIAPILAATLGVLTARLFQSLSSKKKRFRLGAIVILTCVLSLFAFRSQELIDLTTQQLQGISPHQGAAISSIIFHHPEDANRITSIGSCNRANDLRAAQLATALAYKNVSEGNYSPFELTFLSKDYLFNAMHDFVAQRQAPLVILVNDQVLGNELKMVMSDVPDLVRFVELDSTPETEPVLQCPERLRTLTPQEVKAGIK